MILDDIVLKTKERVAYKKSIKSIEQMRAEAMSVHKNSQRKDFMFEEVLDRRLKERDELAVICEVKKASPSKGVIVQDFDYAAIAEEYEKAGADAISVLTEPYFFQGSDDYLKEIRKKVEVPLLRKDFTVDEYMIYEAKVLGADAVLLICAVLDEDTLEKYIEIAYSLGMSALVEVHDEKEAEAAVNAGARLIGVNNRNLKDFSVDLTNTSRMAKALSARRNESLYTFISESGIKTPEDARYVKKNGASAILVGESFMRADDKKALLDSFR